MNDGRHPPPDPVAASLAQRMAALTPPQRALLQRELSARGIRPAVPDAPASQIAGPKVDSPLSPAQRHLWVAHALQPRSSAYHIALAWTFSGALDADALRKALERVIARHAVLRTAFLERDGRLVQRVHAEVRCALPIVDAGADPAALERRCRELAAEPFDLAQPPLLRATLLRRDATCHVLVLVLHHLVADGWSRGILLRELAAGYGAARAGEEPDLPSLPAQYADYVRAQHAWLETAAAERQIAYWKHQLEGVPPLDLASDRVSDEAGIGAGRTHLHRLPAQLRERVHATARRLRVTPFMLLLAVFDLLLHRYSGSRDIAVSIPVAGRQLPDGGPDIGGLIGFFVNTLVIRVRPRDMRSFGGWLDAVKVAVADAFDHQDVPFASVLEAVNANRKARTPLFELMFQYQGDGYTAQNAEGVGDGFAGLTVAQAAIELNHTKFDMSWHLLEREAGLTLAIEYRAALFAPERAARMAAHFETLLEAVLARPDAHVAALAILPPEERRQLECWQQGPEPADRAYVHGGFVARFEAQARLTPSAAAACTPAMPGAFYAQLNADANRLARRLRALGIGAEARVGVCLERRPLLLVALLGVMKAGAAYVPLDPALPGERLRELLQEAGAAMLLMSRAQITQMSTQPNVPLDDVCSRLVLDDAAEAAVQAALPEHDLGLTLHADQLAYVMFTSGSSGRPKGVMITHAGLDHYLDWCLARYPLREGSGAPVHTSIGFDATITGLFAPLVAGGCVTLLPEGETFAHLAHELDAGHSVVKLTPAHLSALRPLLETRSLAAAGLPRALIIGGEALTEAHVGFWRERFPEIALINEYGPTETVVGCATYRVRGDDRGAIPIGSPIAGAALHLLDAYLDPVPAGVPGELFIGGGGMARGYQGRPAQTAERFLPDPFAPAGGVMYRTGDLAVRRGDGQLVYLGRADRQLKLRGYRIEPGEVEAALARQPGVEEALVCMRETGAGLVLVAYVRLNESRRAAATESALRSGLAARLPGYMIPARFVILDAFPLTPNGKIDQDTLPLPVRSQTAPAAARTELERELLAIWREALGRTDIGVHDDFLELGGDSIVAIQIVARMRRAGYVLSPEAFFRHPSIAAQAGVVQVQEPGADAAARPASETGEIVLGPMQWRFFEQVRAGDLPQPRHYNQSVLLAIAPDTDLERLRAALDRLLQRHGALRLRFRRTADGTWRAAYDAAAVSVPFAHTDLGDPGTAAEREAALAAALEDDQRALDPERGPLFRAHAFTLGPREARLFLAAHHLVVDAVSWRLLLVDLVELYVSLETDAPITAYDAVPYAAWSASLQERAARFAREQAHWQAACAGVVRIPDSATPALEADAQELEAALDPETSAALQSGAAGRAEALLVTALAQTLARWLRSDAVTVDMEGHGRQPAGADMPAPERTVGWFTAVYPLRLELPAGDPGRQLQAVQRTLAATPAHGLGFGVLRMAGVLAADSPAQVLFNYLGRVDARAGGFVVGLAPERVPAQRSPAGRRRYALEVIAFERAARLCFVWRYCSAQIAPALAAQLAQRYSANVRTLIALGAAPDRRVPIQATEIGAQSGAGSEAARALLARLGK